MSKFLSDWTPSSWHPRILIRDRFMSLKQGKNKIPQSYLAKKEQLWLKAYPLDTRDPRQLRREVTLGLYHPEVRKQVFCALPSITNIAVLRETIMNEVATQRQLIQHGDAEDTSMDGCKGEAAAMIYGIRKFSTILSFKPFIINTDNSALKQLKSLKKNTGMMACWTEELAGYEFRVIHRPGRLNTNADALSRRTDSDMPDPTAEEEAEQEEYVGAVDEDEEDHLDTPRGRVKDLTRDNIYKHQLEDPILEIVRKWIGVDHHAPDRAALRGQSQDMHRFAEIFDTL